MANDRDLMAQALEEGRRGRPSPNPHVGAVIARDGVVVSAGHHAKAGEAHAEVDAIRNAPGPVDGATLYVTLEPCNHQGRTGPCTEAIIDAGIGRVVIGCRDPAPHEPGAIDRLKAAGIDVDLGMLEDECAALIADFSKHIRTGMPFVTLKAAITLDGKIATRSGDSKWITGDEARDEAHRLRDRSDAVLVGVGTVLADDPKLTVRRVKGRDPMRVVLDADLRTPSSAALLDRHSAAQTLIAHAPDADEGRVRALREAGAELFAAPRTERGVDLGPVLEELGRRDVVRLLVEGGARVHGSFVDLGFADRAAVFVAPTIIGDSDAPSFVAGKGVDRIDHGWRLVETDMRALGRDWLLTGKLERKV